MVVRRTVVVVTSDGLHMRPASELARRAGLFQSEIFFVRDNDRFDCKSVIEIMMTAATHGTTLIIEANGDDATAAVEALAHLIENDFPATPGDETTILRPKQ